MTRANYRGPRGPLQRIILAGMWPGTVYTLPSYPEDWSRRASIDKLIKRGVIELVPGRPHLYRLTPRPMPRRDKCGKFRSPTR